MMTRWCDTCHIIYVDSLCLFNTLYNNFLIKVSITPCWHGGVIHDVSRDTDSLIFYTLCNDSLIKVSTKPYVGLIHSGSCDIYFFSKVSSIFKCIKPCWYAGVIHTTMRSYNWGGGQFSWGHHVMCSYKVYSLRFLYQFQFVGIKFSDILKSFPQKSMNIHPKQSMIILQYRIR